MAEITETLAEKLKLAQFIQSGEGEKKDGRTGDVYYPSEKELSAEVEKIEQNVTYEDIDGMIKATLKGNSLYSNSKINLLAKILLWQR